MVEYIYDADTTTVLNLLMLRPFNTVPHGVVTPPHHNIIFLILYNCNVAGVMNCNVNI